jgi:hypothetical protein
VADLFPANGGVAGQPGQFNRSVSASNIGKAISNWNSTQALTPTPAGQALMSAGLFTQAQLVSLGGVKPFVGAPVANQAGNQYYKEVSMVLSWPIKIREGMTIEPSISAFNIFNLANFQRLTGILNDSVDPTALGTNPGGSVTGTTSGHNGINPDLNSVRTGTGSGVFAEGAPRQVEFGLRLNF